MIFFSNKGGGGGILSAMTWNILLLIARHITRANFDPIPFIRGQDLAISQYGCGSASKACSQQQQSCFPNLNGGLKKRAFRRLSLLEFYGSLAACDYRRASRRHEQERYPSNQPQARYQHNNPASNHN
jgi:hypothetical protein